MIADESFVADCIVKHEGGFDVEEVDGRKFYSLAFLVGRDWFSEAFLDALSAWAAENRITFSELLAEDQEIAWYTLPASLFHKDAPMYLRKLGVVGDEPFLAVDTVRLPDSGIEAKTVFGNGGHKYVSVREYKKKAPDEFANSHIESLIEACAAGLEIELRI